MLGKAALLEAIAGKNRGLLATEQDKQSINWAIAQLEDQNPTPNPVEASDLLSGDWRLLYTDSQGLLNLDQLPFCKLGQIYQCIRATTARVYNIAEIYGLPYLEGLVGVAARFEVASARRVQVKFERSIIGLQRLVGYQSPSEFVQQIEMGKKFAAIDFGLDSRDQQGWLDTTYLDDDLRVGRGNRGNVFVLTKK